MDFTDHMFWDTAISTTDYANYWQDTEPNATVVTIGDADYVNGSGVAHIMYCWHSVNGYSRIGAYRGNGDNHGRFIYTGFRPKYILAKVMSAADSWQIMDTARDPYNVANKRLRPDAYTGENLAGLKNWDYLEYLNDRAKTEGDAPNKDDYECKSFAVIERAHKPLGYKALNGIGDFVQNLKLTRSLPVVFH